MGTKYRSSDRTHVKPTRWTKKERAEWAADVRESAERAKGYMARGDCNNAMSIMDHIAGLRAHGITTPEGLDIRRVFAAKCLVRKQP
jgi:hypothetical protein